MDAVEMCLEPPQFFLALGKNHGCVIDITVPVGKFLWNSPQSLLLKMPHTEIGHMIDTSSDPIATSTSS
jgi:hypothetical protein